MRPPATRDSREQGLNGIAQIYCTHCTYGNSAVERVQGQMASRVLGYSARSSSLAGDELRKYYRQIERFVYYYLPGDTPAEEKPRLDAAQSPRRLFYYPSINGVQLVGQISYRQHDTAGRAGSYFGHVLLADRNREPWSVLDCLRLWGAPWKDAESPDYEFQLDPLASLGALHSGEQSQLNDESVWDQVLCQFLRVEANGSFDDPLHVVPDRWKGVSAIARQDLLASLLQAYLELGAATARRESVLVVVEPSLAALLFYGVARLLPATLREDLSFSTYEPNADRLPVTLAATTFHIPAMSKTPGSGGDLKPEAYRGRGYVHNTYNGQTSNRAVVPGPYVRVAVSRLLNEGPAECDKLLKSFAAAGASNAKELDELSGVLELVPLLFNPGERIPEISGSPAVERYLGQAVRRRLAQEMVPSPLLDNLIGTPRQLWLLERVATNKADPEGAVAIQFLLDRLPESAIGALLASSHVAREYKLDKLQNFVESEARFPADCPSLWSIGSSRPSRLSTPADSLLPDLLEGLKEPLLPEVVASLGPRPSESQVEALLFSLIGHYRKHDSRPAPRRLIGEYLGKMTDGQLCTFLQKNAGQLSPETWPEDDPGLGERLFHSLAELVKYTNRPEKFDARLGVLLNWQPLISAHETKRGMAASADDAFGYRTGRTNKSRKQIEGWNNVREALNQLNEIPPPPLSNGFTRLLQKTPPANYNEFGIKISDGLLEAISDPDERIRCLDELCSTHLTKIKTLPTTLRDNIEWACRNNGWSTSVKTLTSTSQGRSNTSSKLVVGALVLLCVILSLLIFNHTPTQRQVANNRPPQKPSVTSDPPAVTPSPVAANPPAQATGPNALPSPPNNGKEKPAPEPPQPARPIVPVVEPQVPLNSPTEADAPSSGTKPQTDGDVKPGPNPSTPQPTIREARMLSGPPTSISGDMVRTFVMLPSQSDGDAMFAPVLLKRLAKKPTAYNMRVLGIAAANARLNRNGPNAEWQLKDGLLKDDAIDVDFINTLSDQGRERVARISFIKGLNAFQFEWNKMSSGFESYQDRLQFLLRSCVLQIDVDGTEDLIAFGGDRNEKPLLIKQRQLLLNGEALQAEVVSQELDLYLRCGKLHSGQNDPIPFQSDIRSTTCKLPKYAALFEASDVWIELSQLNKDKNNPWRLELNFSVEAIKKEKEKQRAAKLELISNLNTTIKKFETDQKTPGEEAHVAKLATLLGIKEYPERPNYSGRQDQEGLKRRYAASVKAEVIDPAKSRVTALKEEIQQLSKDIDGGMSSQVRIELNKVTDISVALFRLVDHPTRGTIECDVMIIGDPYPSEK